MSKPTSEPFTPWWSSLELTGDEVVRYIRRVPKMKDSIWVEGEKGQKMVTLAQVVKELPSDRPSAKTSGSP